MIEEFIKYMNNINNKNGKFIILDYDYEIIEIQKYLCNLLKNCYIYTFINNDNNQGYQIYKNKLFCIFKHGKKKYYIKIIN